MENLWQKLNEIITNYEHSTENKRKQYEYLKKQDDIHQAEAIEFPKIYTKTKEDVEILSKSLVALSQEREVTIEDLTSQSETLTKRACKLRQEIKMFQTIDAIQLKRLSVVSNKVIKASSNK
jgi:hypothetical protein